MQKFSYPCFHTKLVRPWPCQSSLAQFLDNIMYLSALMRLGNYSIILVRTRKNSTLFNNTIMCLFPLLHKNQLINPSTTIYGNLGQSLGSSLILRVDYFLDYAHVSLHRSPSLEAFFFIYFHFMCIGNFEYMPLICLESSQTSKRHQSPRNQSQRWLGLP